MDKLLNFAQLFLEFCIKYLLLHNNLPYYIIEQLSKPQLSIHLFEIAIHKLTKL